MNLFIGVIYLCIAQQCIFLQSEKPYNNEHECIIGVIEASKQLEVQNKGSKIDVTCIAVRFVGA